MFLASNFVAFLLGILLSCLESETANVTALISKSPSPSFAVEGKNITLEWTYTLDGTFLSGQLAIANDDGSDLNIGIRGSPGAVTVQAQFQARFRGYITDTRAELTILAVQRSDEEKYKINIFSSNGGSVSEAIHLVVNFSSSITNITGQNVLEGGNVTLKCLAEGKPKPTITWIRLSDDQAVTMPLININRNDPLAYRCTASNGVGIPATREIFINVQFSSSITKITGENVLEGWNVTLKCLAEGKPKPTITWTRLSDNQTVTMPLININRNDSREYRCTASNGVGIPATREIFINVQYQPSLTSIFVTETVNDGDLLWPNCTADGFPAPKTTWTRLSTNKTVSMPLTISGKQDEGFYRCTANNGVGNPSTADLFVIVQFYRPFNTYLSTNLTNAASLNEIFYLKCNAEANPAAEYRLHKENETVANITARIQNNGLYAISVGDRVKEVVYRCIPFNSFGDGPAKTLVVTVHYPVEATGKGKNFTVAKGGGKTITCPVDGNPKPNIKWYEGSEASGKLKSSENVFTVKHVMESVCYTCVASNSLGTQVSISYCLIVDTKRATSFPKPSNEPEVSARSLWAIVGAVAGGVVVLGILVGVLTWWVHKQRKCRKDTKSKDQTLLASSRSRERLKQSFL